MDTLVSSMLGGASYASVVANGGASARTSKKVWDLAPFTAEFCDHFADDLRNAHEAYDVVNDFERLVDSLITELSNETFANGWRLPAGVDVADARGKAILGLRKILVALDRGDMAWRKVQLYNQNKASFHLSRLIDEISRQIQNLRAGSGEMAILPLYLPTLRYTVVVLAEAHPTRGDVIIVTVINPSYRTGHHAMCVDESDPSKIKQLVALPLGEVPKRKFASEAFWAATLVSASKVDQDDYFYSHFISWLVDRPFHEQLEISKAQYGDRFVYATPARSATTVFWKSLIHTLKYTLRVQGLSSAAVRYVRMHVKLILLRQVVSDMDASNSITVSQARLVTAAAQGTASCIARNHGNINGAYLKLLHRCVEEVDAIAMRKSKDMATAAAEPPKLELDQGWERQQQPDTFPLMECFRRIESVDQFAGAKVVSTKAASLNFLTHRQCVTSLKDIISAVNQLVVACLQLAAADAGSLAKNPVPLTIAMVHHAVFEVLPIPLGPKSRARGALDLWAEDITNGEQLQLMKRLHELTELYVFASQQYNEHRRSDALRMTCLAALATMADCAARKIAIDDPSPLSLVLSGAPNENDVSNSAPPSPYMWTLGHYAQESAHVMFLQPEALQIRTQVLDYVAEMLETTPLTNVMWKWEETMHRCAPTERLVRAIASRAGVSLNNNHPMVVFCGAEQTWASLLNRYFTEFRYLRDIVMYCKLYTGRPHQQSNPTVFRDLTASMTWQYHESEGLYCYCFGGVGVNPKGSARPDAVTSPSTYTQPAEVSCEDDLLHIKNLPTFDDAMGQRDSELLLSYLTAPYVRIPLILRFFATEDRVSCLRSNTVTKILTGVLFEPGRFLPYALSGVCPEKVPSEDANLIAVPYGLLVNELQHCPSGVIEPLVRLVALARELDAGTVFNDSVTTVILFLAKTIARVENYIDFSLRHMTDSRTRDVNVTEAALANLRSARDEIRGLIRGQLVPMLQRWTEEALLHALSKECKSVEVDVVAMLTGKLHTHVMLLHRNVTPEDYDVDFVTSFVSSFTYLTTRWGFSTDDDVTPLELYEVVHRHRRFIASWLHQAPISEVSAIMEDAVRVATSSSAKVAGTMATRHKWGVVAGNNAIARFTRLDDDLTRQSTSDLAKRALGQLAKALQQHLGLGDGSTLPNGAVPVIEGRQEVEINLHTMCLTFKAAHLKCLPGEIAADHDVQSVLLSMVRGNVSLLSTLQCAMVEEGENRLWVRLVGQDHDVQFWRTIDARHPIPTDLMRFFPDDLASTEQWVFDLFEPVRQTHFERSFWEPPIFILLPDKKLTPDCSVASLTAVCSKTGRKLKEVYVFRDYKCVHVYDVVSHGRRFYRTLVYTTDARFCMLELQPDIDDRFNPWTPWGRYAAGSPDPDRSTQRPMSCVVLRHASHPDNRSKSTETFIPRRFLYGIVPSSLLETHQFWQDADDNLRGYPLPDEKGETPRHLLWVHWREADFDPLGAKNTCARVYRFADSRSAPRASEAAVLRSRVIKVADAIDEELELTRTGTEDESLEDEERRERELAAQSEGLYREASFLANPNYKPPEAATIEDHNLMLLDIQYARAGTPLHSLAQVMARLELMSHVLVWTTKTDYGGSGQLPIDLVQLPRLKLSFSARRSADGSCIKLYSLDHAHLHISNDRPALVVRLMEGIPHSLLLADASAAYSILVPSLAVVRPEIQRSPFTTELVLNRSFASWYSKLDTRYYLYQVHVSLSFMFTPTLASALYLLLLRFFHRDYSDVFRLAGTIGTDMQLNAEESQIFQLFSNINDTHPNAFACRARISLLVSDAPVLLGWYTPHEVARMLSKRSHVSVSCRLSDSEERRLLYHCHMLERKMAIIREFATKTSKEIFDFAVKKAGLAVKAAQAEEEAKANKLDPIPNPFAANPFGQNPFAQSGFGASPFGAGGNGFMPFGANTGFTGTNKFADFGTLMMMREAQNAQAQNNNARVDVDETSQKRRQLRAFHNQLTTLLREKLDVRVLQDDLQRLLLTFHKLAMRPLMPYLSCLLANRRSVIEAEAKARLSGGEPQPATLYVPDLHADLNYLFYRDYNPLTVKTGMPPQLKNDEGRVLKPSTVYDYWYCQSNVRQANQCACRSCNEVCGGDGSGVGCPCPSCERFNAQELGNIRFAPEDLAYVRSMRTLTFYEALTWVGDAFARSADIGSTRNVTRPFQDRNPELSLREDGNCFLRYYEILTGTTRVRIGSQPDCGKDLCQLLFHVSREARNPMSALGDMMHFLVNTPAAWMRLPKYQRQSKQKAQQRLATIYNGVLEQASLLCESTKPAPVPFTPPAEPAVGGPKFPAVAVTRLISPRPATRTPEVPLIQTTILPFPRNTDCAGVELYTETNFAGLRLLGDDAVALAMTPDEVRCLGGAPLCRVVPEGLIVSVSRDEQELPRVPETLPFDLSGHSAAAKSSARGMLHRLSDDMKDFASQANGESVPKVKNLESLAAIRRIVQLPKEAAVAHIKQIIKNISSFVDVLVALRESDVKFVAFAMPALSRTANHVDDSSGDLTSTLLSLRRFAGKEAELTVEYLASSICSTSAEDEWRQLNPFLTEASALSLKQLILLTVLRANRTGHANRATEAARELIQILSKLSSAIADGADQHQHGGHRAHDAIVANLAQKADHLANITTAPRVYFETLPDGKSFKLDPRFLLFEFTWNLILRDRQRELVHDMYRSITGNQSIVKQMIMGAGKTTVVGPLLALMLANGDNLVMQVVPPALLDFTRAVLRTTFSSVLQKQIFTFTCDRASEIDSELLFKFLHAKQSRGIIVTTPSAIKSVYLKFVEALDRITDSSRKRSAELEKESKDMLGVLNLWRDGVLIMDEVDLLLHPLKSELNFPVGTKHEIDFTPTRWRLPIHLIDALFYHHTRRITVNMKDSAEAHAILMRFSNAVAEGLQLNALQEMPHLTLLNLDYYESHLKPVLAEWLLLFLKAQHLVGLNEQSTLRYLLSRPTSKEDPDFVRAVSKLEPDHVKMLNFAHDWLSSFLPHIMQKIDRVSFGIMNPEDMRRAREEHPNMPRSRFVTAIPFIGKDLPSQSSEFAHPDVVIGLTVMAYRYEGLRRTDFNDIMSDIHSMVEKEVGRFNQRKTTLMYNKWVQAAGGTVLRNFNYSDKKAETGVDEDVELTRQLSSTRQISSRVESTLFGEESGTSIAARSVLPLKLMKQGNTEESDKLFKLFSRTAEVIHWYLCESVFPEHMRHQQLKLSASGQELGGSALFNRRIGFSGTPSDLLPIELGKCEYERGTDGQLLHVLTSPNVLGYEVKQPGWTVASLLDYVAHANPPFHALIDTGALITGMSNLQVARYLLRRGLPQMEGVVFLDEFDRKMILVRATGRVLKLAECGIPKVKRFAFYDQVHTTGMDIEHTPNATAVQTLGKDMTFRDFSQGAYRMRGIGQGQRVQLLIIPEVYDLIVRSMSTIRETVPDLKHRKETDVLVDVSAWLLLNSIKSEQTQHNQLAIQSCANVWRKEAFETLKARVDEFKVNAVPSEAALRALRVFQEPVDFAVRGDVPEPQMFSECIAEYVAANSEFILTDEARRITDGLVANARAEDELNKPVIDVQMVQEQEEEKEQELEKDQEKEIEMEKFVDLAYSRDAEHSASWNLSTLVSTAKATQFYKLSDFHLTKRRAIDFPESIMLSRNYFDPRWGGHRRIKNVIITMEWIPDTNAVETLVQPSQDYGVIDHDAAFDYFARTIEQLVEHQGTLTSDLAKDLMQTALHTTVDEADWKPVWDGIAAGISADATNISRVIFAVLKSNALRLEESGRYTVAVTLEEAETIRRVIHLKNMSKQSIVPDANVSLSLLMVSSNNIVLDQTAKHPAPKREYQRFRNFQSLRFFDCDLQYSDAEFGQLIRAVHKNPEKVRQAFFSQIIACRRRARQRWEKTPIAQLFVTPTAFTLLRQKVIGLCLRRELDVRHLHLADAFLAFNHSHSGVLTPDEVWGAMRWCRLDSLSAVDVLDFVDFADTNREGTVQYPDFICALTGSRDIDDEGAGGDEESQHKKLPVIEPFGADVLKVLAQERTAARRADEAEANKELGDANSRVMEEIEADQIREELEMLRVVSNPQLRKDSFIFSFQHEDRPKLISTFGGKVCKYVEDNVPSILMSAGSGLRASLRTIKSLNDGKPALTSYSLTFEFKLPRPTVGDTKIGTLARLQALGFGQQIASWPLPFFVLIGDVAIDFEEKLFEKEANKEANGDDADDAAALEDARGPKFTIDDAGGRDWGAGGKARASKGEDWGKGGGGGRGGRGGGGGLFAPRGGTSIFNSDRPQKAFGAPAAGGFGFAQAKGGFGQPGGFGRGGFGASNVFGGGGGGFGQPAFGGFNPNPGGFGGGGGWGNSTGGWGAPAAAAQPAGWNVDPNKSRLHVFSRPDPAAENVLAEINAGVEVEATGEAAHTTIDGASYEWMRIKAFTPSGATAEIPSGWVVRERSGRSPWKQSSAIIKLNGEGKVIMSIEKATPSEGAQGTILLEVDDDDANLQDAEKEENDEEALANFQELALMGDVGDLLEAVKKARLLVPGDKVQRNPDEWTRGSEDGGEGKTGRVLKVEGGVNVQVQWPNGNKGTYSWGDAGKFELIKVGDAEEGDEGEAREVLNDERWAADLRTGGASCGHCNLAKLEPGNWFRCNHCEPAAHLCKKCFKSGVHPEHDFTDMQALHEEMQDRAAGGLTIGGMAKLKPPPGYVPPMVTKPEPVEASPASSSFGTAPATGFSTEASASGFGAQSAFGAAPVSAAAAGGFGAQPGPGFGFGAGGFGAAAPATGFGAAPAAPAGGFGAQPGPGFSFGAGGFGAAAPATGFGAAPAAPAGGFGAQTAPAFGFGAAPVPATGAFGAQPASAFGFAVAAQEKQAAPGGDLGAASKDAVEPAAVADAVESTPGDECDESTSRTPASNKDATETAPAQAGFGAAAAPAAGFGAWAAPAACAGGFGAQPAPGFGGAGGFGAAAPATGFGAAPAAPAGGFGAQTAPAFGFGAAPTAPAGGFGAAPAVATTSGSGFGAPMAVPEPATVEVPSVPPIGAVGVVVDIDRENGLVILDIPGFGEWTVATTDVTPLQPTKQTEKDEETEGSTVNGPKRVPALEFLQTGLRNGQGLKRLIDAATRPTKYVVGDNVRYKRPDGGFFSSNQVGVVKAVLNGGENYLIEGEGSAKTVAKSEIIGLMPFKAGDKVRYKKGGNLVGSGFQAPFPPDLPEHLRYRAVAKIQGTSSFGDSLYCQIQFPQCASSVNVLATELECVDDSYAWFVTLSGQTEQHTSSSAAVSLERGFQDGEKTVGFLHRDVPMIADFSSFKIYAEGTVISSGAASIGTIRRDPEEQWAMAEEKKIFDDGKWHILTIIVHDNIIAAVCDGEKIRVQYEGSLVTKVQDVMTAAHRRASEGPASPGAPTPAIPTIASHIPLMVNAPITLFSSNVTGEEFRRQTNMACGSTFPRRLLAYWEVSWGVPDLNAVVAQHVVMDCARSWICRGCKTSNTRQVDTCANCGEPRTEKKGAREVAQGKVKAVYLRSREAQAVRRRVQNKLRSQYQRLLDSYDDGATAAARRRAVVMEELL